MVNFENFNSSQSFNVFCIGPIRKAFADIVTGYYLFIASLRDLTTDNGL